MGAGKFEGAVEPGGRFPKETRHHSLVPDDVEGERELRGYRLGNAGLPVAGRPSQTRPVARLDAVAAQQIGALLFLDFEALAIALLFGFHEIQKQVSPCHGPVSFGRAD